MGFYGIDAGFMGSNGILWDFLGFTLINFYITVENHHAVNGKVNYFYGHVQLLCNKLPEGMLKGI